MRLLTEPGLRLDRNVENSAGFKKIGIVRTNGFRIADRLQGERFEERPIVEVVAVARSIINTAQVALVNFPGSELRQAARFPLLQNRHVYVLQSEFEALRREDLAKVAYPFRTVDICTFATGCSGSKYAIVTPSFGDRAQRKEVVLPINFVEFREQRDVGSKSGESFKKA